MNDKRMQMICEKVVVFLHQSRYLAKSRFMAECGLRQDVPGHPNIDWKEGASCDSKLWYRSRVARNDKLLASPDAYPGFGYFGSDEASFHVTWLYFCTF